MTEATEIGPETVAVTRCADYDPEGVLAAVERQFTLLGGIERFIHRGDTVLLKPNFIVPRPAEAAVQTHPAVILAVAKIVKDFGGRPFVADSPAWGSVAACIKALELEESLKKMGVGFRALNKPVRHRLAGSSVGISSVALDADRIINLPKLKAHQQLGATFAIKNMFGCVSGKEKAFWHFARGASYEDFCRMLIEIYALLSPAVTIIDGVVGMEGQGPIRGKARRVGFLIGGAEPVACERVCCAIVNFDVENLPLLRVAKQIGLGCPDLDAVKIAGYDYRDFVCKDFKPAEQTPLRFSFARVCKSVCRQLVLLGKSALRRFNGGNYERDI